MMSDIVETEAGPEAPPLQPHLSVTGVCKRFGGVEALKDVSFDVARGEVVALVGDNGAGKSTLMKVLAGAHSADEGQFTLDGKPVTVTSPNEAAALGIQIVYQDLALCENLDVAANLSLGDEPLRAGWSFLPRFLRPIDDMEMEVKARAALDVLQVKTLKSVRAKVGGLSGGQRQAIAIARAVGADSTVVLLDEPTAALGVAQTRQVLDVVKRLRDTGHAVVYISHNLRDIFEVADRITVLRHGQNVATWRTQETTPDEIVVAMTRGLDGAPQTNPSSHSERE
ncbi:ATP-binding cassette domain-containing protein [Celeribacter sp.]|uniref:ATP-binding cassette domain-containing protein n=1 Tax=Celeribacter sp. TaxID=1890673 RepID=UPI003A8CE580